MRAAGGGRGEDKAVREPIAGARAREVKRSAARWAPALRGREGIGDVVDGWRETKRRRWGDGCGGLGTRPPALQVGRDEPSGLLSLFGPQNYI